MFGSDDDRATEVVASIEAVLDNTEARDDLPPVIWL
ncbi:MAG: hypothetical protein ACI80F_002359 [Natronomonas sp.]|jgi:hypothetical protein